MSFLNNLRRMVGMKQTQEPEQKVKKEIGAEAFNVLSERFAACEDEAQKAALWEQMSKALPQTLFLASMCYEGEDPKTPVSDRELHATSGAKKYYAINQAVVTNGNPGYRLSKNNDRRRIHLHTLVYNKTKEEWVPLFTDFTKFLPVFGQKTRVTIISFDEARKIAKPYKGLVINPGPNGIRLNQDALKGVK